MRRKIRMRALEIKGVPLKLDNCIYGTTSPHKTSWNSPLCTWNKVAIWKMLSRWCLISTLAIYSTVQIFETYQLSYFRLYWSKYQKRNNSSTFLKLRKHFLLEKYLLLDSYKSFFFPNWGFIQNSYSWNIF